MITARERLNASHGNFLADGGDALLAPFFVTPLRLLIKLFCLGKFVAKEALDLMMLDTKMDPQTRLHRAMGKFSA